MRLHLVVFLLSASIHGQSVWTNAFPYRFDIEYGNNMFVTVGDVCAYSRDGTNWNQSLGGGGSFWCGVAFGNGCFVAVQRNGSAARSKNGVVWEFVDLAGVAEGPYQTVRFLNGSFYALGAGVLKSEDGRSWVPKTISTRGWYTSIMANPNKMIAVGNPGDVAVSSSTTWTVTHPFSYDALTAVGFFNGNFLLNDERRNGLFSSPDGVTWTQNGQVPQEIPAFLVTSNFIVGVGTHGQIVRSDDAQIWQQIASGTTQWLVNIKFLNNDYYACGTGNAILKSVDTINWQSLLPEAPFDAALALYSVTAGGDTQLISGQNGIFLRRRGAGAWLPATPPSQARVRSMTYFDGQFYAVTTNIYSSPDGSNWTRFESPTPTATFLKIATVSTQVVATAALGAIYYKTNSAWESVNVNTNTYLYGITYGNGRYVVFGDRVIYSPPPPDAPDPTTIPTVYSSPDLIHWTPGPTNLIAYYAGAFGNGRIVLVGTMGHTLWSDDGVTWNESIAPTGAELLDIVFANGQFVVAGDPGYVLISKAGTNWTKIDAAMPDWLNSITATDHSFIGVSQGGAIVEAPFDLFFDQATPGSGDPAFRLFGPPAPQITIESSTNLSTWQLYTNVSSPEYPQTLKPSTTNAQTFYRAKVAP